MDPWGVIGIALLAVVMVVAGTWALKVRSQSYEWNRRFRARHGAGASILLSALFGAGMVLIAVSLGERESFRPVVAGVFGTGILVWSLVRYVKLRRRG